MFHFFSRIFFIFGFTIGIFLAVYLKSHQNEKKSEVKRPLPYEKWLKETKVIRKPISFDLLRYGNASIKLESTYLYEKIPILCLILVKSERNSNASKNTWARGCNEIATINLDVERNKKLPSKRNKNASAWILLCNALREIETKFKWILVVYDYTFVIIENLRLFVAGLNASDKYYLGHAVQFWGTVYNMGQTGYAISKGALIALKNRLNSSDSCARESTYFNREDYYLGKVLSSLNITPSNTNDANGLSTFHPYNLYHAFSPGENHYKFSIYPNKCCSPWSIAFQAIEGDKMYTYYYLLYSIQLFTEGNLGNRKRVTSLNDNVWKNFLISRNLTLNVTNEEYYRAWEDLVDDPTSFARHMKRDFDDNK